MAVRRKTENRLVLYRKCHICGKEFRTQADTPWVRQLPNVDGKKQKTCYFCSSKCYASSYKHIGWFDGQAEKRREEKEARRDIKGKNYKYYHAHEEEMRERRHQQYWNNREEELESNKYYRRKRKLMKGDSENAQSN